LAEPFTTGLKVALTGNPHARFAYLGNFEVERQWAVGETGLLPVVNGTARAVANRMDELTVALAGGGDHVVLKAAPEPGFLRALARLGRALPGVVAGNGHRPDRTVTQDALADPRLLRALSELAADGTCLLPHGVSTMEEELAERTGLRLATAPAAVCKAVNSKVYGRRLATELGLRQTTGWACERLEELVAAVAGARRLLDAGRRVVVKDAFGVSGQGMLVIDRPERLDRLLRMVAGLVRRRDHDRIGLVVEEWVDKDADLSYQFTVGRDGTVRFDFVREALIDKGAHKGNRMPARLDARQLDEVRRCARLIGARLAGDGYYGVVGVDAMTDPDGGLYPVVEINARNNMSTYHASLYEQVVGAGMVALARHYPLRLIEPMRFGRLRRALGDLLLDAPGGAGLVVNAFATVNAGLHSGGPATGRLCGFVVAGSFAELDAMDREVVRRLGSVTGGTGID
jgi:hypothetical protein